jgi:hypothetical protein
VSIKDGDLVKGSFALDSGMVPGPKVPKRVCSDQGDEKVPWLNPEKFCRFNYLDETQRLPPAVTIYPILDAFHGQEVPTIINDRHC